MLLPLPGRRIAGYDEAPLAKLGPEGFQHLELAPFEDDDLREFVKRWYAIQLGLRLPVQKRDERKPARIGRLAHIFPKGKE